MDITKTMQKLTDFSLISTILHGKSCVYVDFCVHGNIGDILIYHGTEKFFKEYKIKVVARYSILDFKFKEYSKDIVFVLHGGGNFGDLYIHHQIFREKLMTYYPNNKIVVLPQSLQYNNLELYQIFVDKAKNHKDLHLFFRDQESYNLLHTSGIQNIYLHQDMCHILYPLEPISNKKSGTLFFQRRDKEKTRSFSEKSIDWKDILGIKNIVCIRVFQIAFMLNKYLQSSYLEKIWYRYTIYLVAISTRYFSSYNKICANRLHALLLALLLNKKVIPIDNSYGKISKYFAKRFPTV